jgi:hypothetical protein
MKQVLPDHLTNKHYSLSMNANRFENSDPNNMHLLKFIGGY